MRRLAYSIVLVAGVCGCGSDVTADQACTDIAKANCTELMTCSSADLQRRWGDITTCEAREKLTCTAALAAPKTANSPSHEQSCGDAESTEQCPAFLSGVMPPAACLPPKGTGANGAACSYSAQCQSAFCAIPPNSFCGTCAAEPVAGDSCANQGCGPTLDCVPTTMLCQAPVADGGQCSKDLPCIEGESCVGATATAMGTCMAQGTTVGATCDARQMTGPNCSAAAGLTCDSSTNQCVTQMLVAAGQPCGVINNVVVGCLAGASCVKQAAGGSLCIAPAADGAACDTAAGPACTLPAKCVTTGTGTAGTCELPGSQSC